LKKNNKPSNNVSINNVNKQEFNSNNKKILINENAKDFTSTNVEMKNLGSYDDKVKAIFDNKSIVSDLSANVKDKEKYLNAPKQMNK